MRVSLINLNWVAQDAIGQCLIHQVRYFRRRGDEVQVYTMHQPEGIDPADASANRVVDLIDLAGRQDAFFASSDLYVYHYPGRYALLDTMKGLDRGAVIFYYHNVTPPDLWGASTGREELAAGQAAVAKIAPYADLVVTVSPFNAQELVQEHGLSDERIRVLPLAVPLERFHPGPADPALARQHNLLGKRVILFVGRVAGNKRVDRLVEALAQVREQVDNAVLLVVGDHSSNPAFAEVLAGIRRRGAELGVADHVIFTGRVDDLPPYYRLADVYASASIHEGFGVPLIEAMASGVPVVAANATAHPWVIGDAGVLVDPDDTPAMAAALTTILQDDTRRGELAKAGEARARTFALEAFNAGWGEIVDEVAAWLVAHPTRPLRLPGPPTVAGGTQPTLADLPLDEEIESLHKAAVNFIQPYTVRSNAPLVGPLIAWVRRNLTSHLKEPYLDPALRRQERFNWLVVQAMRQVGRTLTQTQSDQVALDARVAATEAQMAALLETLINQIEAMQQQDDATRAATLDDLHAKLTALREQAQKSAEAE